MTSSRAFVGLLAVSAVLGTPLAAAPPDSEYQRSRDKAETLYAEGSYARALQLYQRLGDLDLPAPQARWVEFRIADASWRAQAGSRTHDDTVLETARRRLETLSQAIQRPQDRDGVWAEVHESLGDFWWLRRGSQNWAQGWKHYQQALDFWAGNRDLQTARRRYLEMVWRMADPAWRQNDYWYYHNIPLNVLENARTIARDALDRARAHYLLAMALKQYGGSWSQRRRIETEFEAALAFGRTSPWYDDALFHYAQWMANNGRVIRTADGQWRQQPDFVKAVELYRRLTREFRKGQTRYYDNAKNQIKQITEPQLNVAVASIFLPGSEVQFDVKWRNLGGVDLALYRVDLTRDVDPTVKERNLNEWVWHLDPAGGRKVKAWRFDTRDTGEHTRGRESIRVDQHLPVGAYLLEATAHGKTARDLILVTDLSIVLKSWRGKVIAYVCDAIDGSPVPGARVQLWTYTYRNDRFTGSEAVEKAGDDGLTRFTVDASTRNRERYYGYLVTAAVNGRQAFAMGGGFSHPGGAREWTIYAATDRPAYRPLETVRWKITARTNNGGGYTTPAEKSVRYQISGPRGKVDEGVLQLNAFGTAWAELVLGESLALGEYQVTFSTTRRSHTIGSATLFRLEEYKLPEFEVLVSMPRDDAGRTRAFRVGDTVQAEIQASYFFGGPVAGANVEVLVYQKPFYHRWSPPRDYPWLYGDRQGSRQSWWGGPGQIIKRETLTTDDSGRVTISFETPAAGGQDFEYTIEARVTDASRREIVGTDSVRVTRQRYYVYPKPAHNLYRPGDTVEIEFKALDANQAPVTVQGVVKVTRQRWVEVWTDPAGREVSGWALREAQRGVRSFPPPPGRDGVPWRMKFRGYTSQEVLTRIVRTDAAGEAVVSFVARDEGYYRVTWRSEDAGASINAETSVWVADRSSTELGYHQGGVEIIVDSDTFRAGQDAVVMLSVPTNDRWVLFSVEGDDLHECRLVHVTGSVKLIHVPIRQRHIPNVYLHAIMVSDGQMHVDRKEVVVPPVEQFLDVEIVPDREAYQPRDRGSFTVFTRDMDGNPVSAEVAFALVDESVYAIQQPYAGDPRQFFYDRRQATHVVRTTSTFNHKAYLKLVEVEDGDRLIDAKLAGLVSNENRLERDVRASNGLRQRAAGRGGSTFGGGDLAFADVGMPMEVAEGLSKTTASGLRAPPASKARQAAGQQPAVVVRSDFRSTIFWKPDVVTGDDGRATVSVTYADNLTRWKATARAATTGSRFGFGTATTRTRQPLMARLQAPRFFVVGDTVTLSGLFNNNTARPMTIRPSLEAQGLTITAVVRGGRPVGTELGSITIPAHGESRIDWLAAVEHPGEAVLRLVATGDEYRDAMEMTYDVYDHGIETFLARSGKVRGEVVTFTMEIPEQRRIDSTTVTVSIASSMAVTMLDALPYLVDYPYGCTEQTMSRFLPAVITARTLGDLGLSADDALGRVFGGIERRFVEKTHPKGAAKRENLHKLDVIVNQGLERLYDFQHSDGGWGWWKGGQSDHFMTAYVLWGLSLARQAGLDVRGHAMQRAGHFLDVEIVEQENNPDIQAWMLHALATWATATDRRGLTEPETAAMANLWARRRQLNAYSRALLALAAHEFGDRDKAMVLVRNLENGVKRDNAPDTSIMLGSGRRSHPAVIGTAHWGEDGLYWRWSDGGVEATAFALRAMLAITPGNELIEPVTNWLIKNRRGGQWSNTRDTAITVLALNDYLKVSGELESSFEYDLIVNGTVIASRKITAADALGAPSRFVIDPKHIRSGANEFRIVRRNGAGPIYFAVEASFFTLVEPVPPAGNEIFVRREYYKLVPRRTLLKGYVYDRVELGDGDYVTSGERVQVVVSIEAKNNYEYLVFEDLKPAGFEAVQLHSGESMAVKELKASGNGDFTGRQRWVHQELRDRTVAMFIDKLPEGLWQMTYDLRAEVPGRFHALPVLGHAMYVPEIRCNSGEIRITVNDRPTASIIAVGD